MDTHFTSDERKMLLSLLQKEEKTLQVEINHAFHREFKLILKERLQTVTTLIDKLKVTESVMV